MKPLIDISALAACFKEYGAHPLHYIYRLLMPAENTAYNLLGNTVNAMFDALVSHPEKPHDEQLHDILQQAWHDDALFFLTTDDDSLNRRYFQVIGQQYKNVQQIIDKEFHAHHIATDDAWLEPSFVCPSLGLSGRMDLLSLKSSQEQNSSQQQNSSQTAKSLQADIVELKSGKMNEWEHHAKQAHRVQTMLYAEILHRCLNIPKEEIHGYLHYNTYPLLIAQEYSEDLIREVTELQQQILTILHEIAIGEGGKYFTRKAVEEMYPGNNGKLWCAHEKPKLLAFVASIEDAPTTVREWFFGRLQFIMREEELRAEQPAAVTLRGLKLLSLHSTDDEACTGLTLSIENASEHDFRTGDPIIVFQLHHPDTQSSNSIVLRGSIEQIDDDQIKVALRHEERPCHFDMSALYALEHDTINSNISQACRSLYQTLLHGGPTLPHCRLIVGPPGTGKTSVTLRDLIRHLAEETSHRVLLLAFTHRAVDEICETLHATLLCEPQQASPSTSDNRLPYLRLGTLTDTPEMYRPYLLQNMIDQCPDRKTLRLAIDQCRFWVGTTARLQATRQLFTLMQFDTIIVDEASQLLDYQVVDLLHQATAETILIGDPKQLPAVTLQEGTQSLFEQMYRQGTPATLLDHQGRMHPDIAELSNQLFYGNKIHAVGLPHQLEEKTEMPRVWFFDVPSEPLGTKSNLREASMVARIVKRIAERYEAADRPWTDKTLGIIVPYRQQIAAIRKELDAQLASLINIDTVERYQGSQRDIIIFTTTVSTPEQLALLSVPIELDDQLIDRKLNVAITRARKHLFIVGNRALLSQTPVYQELLSMMTAKMAEHK